MARLIRHLPAAAATAWIILAKLTGYGSAYAQMAALCLTAASLYSIRRLAAEGEASPIHKGMAFFTAAASISVWIDSGNVWPARQPVAALYAVLFLVAVLPPLLEREVFTTCFARKTTPPAVWNGDIFLAINRHLTALWAVLFAAGFASAIVPAIFNLHGFLWETLFEALIPAALMLGLGAPANKLYPAYYQRKIGLVPAAGADPGDSSAQRVSSSEPMKESNPFQKENQTMEKSFTIVAVNGSPHAGFGNTSMMLEMLRPIFAENGLSLEVINLCEHDIDYCVSDCQH